MNNTKVLLFQSYIFPIYLMKKIVNMVPLYSPISMNQYLT